MASATVDAPSAHRLHAEALPVVDLRLLSIQELYALSLTSASSADLTCCDDVVIPKIDRSVFNESAGSRKQTYSRLRLAPRKPELPHATSRRKTIGTPASKFCPDTIDHENRKIINCLLELFDPERRSNDSVPVKNENAASAPEMTSVRDSDREISVDVVHGERKRKRDRKPKKQKPVQGHVIDGGGHDGDEITVAKEALEMDGQIEIELGGSAPEVTGAHESVSGIPIDVVDNGGKRERPIKPNNQKEVQGPVIDSGGHACVEVTASMLASDMDRKNEFEYAGSAPELSCVHEVPIDVFDSGTTRKRARKLKNQKPLEGLVIDNVGHGGDEITAFKEHPDMGRQIGIEYEGLTPKLTFTHESVFEIPIGVVDIGKNIKKRGRKPKNQKPVFDSGGHGSNETAFLKKASDVDKQIEIEYSGSVPKVTIVNEYDSEIPVEKTEMAIAHESVCEIPIETVDAGVKRKRGRKPRTQKPVVDGVGHGRGEIAVFRKFSDMDRQIMNKNGVAVDVVALANAMDPYGPELKKRSEGLVAKMDLLDFLEKVNGEWASTRKKRKIVDASDYGDALPIGWKLLLLLKRREDRASIICSRYISPSGHQFVSCKEASSYMCSLLGLQDGTQTHFCHEMASENTAELTLEDDICKEDQDCYFPSFNPCVTIGHEREAEKIINCSEYYMISNEKDDLLTNPSSPNSADLKGRIGPYYSDILPNDEVCRGRNYNVQSSLDLNRDSVSKPFNSNVESKLNSISEQSRLNVGTNEYSLDDVEELNDYNNSCTLSENSQNRAHCGFDSTHSKVSDAMNIDVVELNLFLGKDDFRCSQVDRIYDEHQIFKSDQDVPPVGELTSVSVSPSLGDVEPHFTPEMASGSCFQTQQREGKTFGSEHVEYNCEMKESKIDDGENLGNSARKKLLIPRKRAIPPQSEHGVGFPDNLKWGLTCGITESKQENGFKSVLSTPYAGEQVFGVNNNLSTVSTCSFGAQKPDVLNSRSSVHVQPCNDKSFEDNENIVSTCNFSFPHQEKASESSLFTSIGSIDNHANNVTQELQLCENSESDSELVFDFGSICSKQEDEDNLDTDDSKMCWNTETNFAVSSPILPAAENMFGEKNNGNGEKTDIESSLLSLSCNNDVQKKIQVSGLWDGQRVDNGNNHQNIRPVLDSGCSYIQSDVWKTDEQSGAVKKPDSSYFQSQNTAYPQVHSPGYFSSFGLMSNKDENELFTSENENKFRGDSVEPMEFDFLTNPKVLSYGADTSPPQWDQVSTVCVWCRTQFCETVDSTANPPASIGLMCPTCKARF